MKRVAIVISTVAAAMMLTALPAISAEQSMGAMGATEQKNECLLYAKKCADTVDSIQQKMAKLKDEIAKGTKTYTPAELQRLNDKLNETNKLLEELTSNP